MDSFHREDPITILKLSTRLENTLHRHGVSTVGELLELPDDCWTDFYGCGAKTITEARDVIARLRTLPMVSPPPAPAPETSAPSFDPSSPLFSAPIDSLDASIRLLNALKRAGLDTIGKLLEFPEDQWPTIRNLGAKSLAELRIIVDSLKEELLCFPVDKSSPGNELSTLASELSEYYGTPPLHRDLLRLSREHPDCQGETFLYLVYELEPVQTQFREKLLKLLAAKSRGLTLDQLSRQLPEHLSNTTILEEALLALENDGKIKEIDGAYTRKYPSVLDYIETMDDRRSAEIISLRLQGKTLEETGQAFDITRERVRQICIKRLSTKRTFDEDQYRGAFLSYDLDKESFPRIFSVPVFVFHYLDTVCDIRGQKRKPLAEMLHDESLSLSVRRSAEAYIYRGYLSVDGQRVPKTRSDLFRYIVKKNCKNKTSFDDVMLFYDQLLQEHGLFDDEKLHVVSSSYKNKLARCDYVLWSQHSHVRYYNIPERDYAQLVSELDLGQYQDTEFSTLKLFREHPDLMEEYDIRDEYELHNLLNKIWPQWGDCEISFPKMPTLRLGRVCVDNQVLDLLMRCAPIGQAAFAEEYEREYGVKAATASGNCFGCIDLYLVNGTYVIDQQGLPPEQHTRMAQVLTEDFYTLTDIRRIYQREFPDDHRRLNAYNIKSLGFLINSTYAVSDRFSNAAVYFRHILTCDDIVDTSQFSPSMTALNAYYSELDGLRAKREIIEFEPKQYINIRRLEAAGVTKEMLDDYCMQASRFAEKNTFFTISSLRQDGFSHTLDDLCFDEWFYSSLLVQDRDRFSYQRAGKNRLFYRGTADVQFSLFLQRLLEQYTRFELDDLLSLLSNRYHLSFSRDKLMQILKDTDLYYDSIMDSVYIDYDTYFEEV